MRGGRGVRAALVAVLAVLALPAAARGAVVALPSGFQEEAVLGGLNQPTSFRFAPNGEVFVAEKGGEILRYEDLEDTTPTVFADLREQVYDNGDRGLLGLAIDPEFPLKPYVYALYTFDHLPGPLGDPPGAYPHWATTPPYEGDPCPKPEDADVDACAVAGRLVKLTDSGGVASSEDVPGRRLVPAVLLALDRRPRVRPGRGPVRQRRRRRQLRLARLRPVRLAGQEPVRRPAGRCRRRTDGSDRGRRLAARPRRADSRRPHRSRRNPDPRQPGNRPGPA